MTPNRQTSTIAPETGLADTASRLRLAIVRTARRLRQEGAGAAKELTPTSVSALATVERHGPLTPSELAEIERVKRPTATRTLRVLEEAGLVDRSPDPGDGRSCLVSVNAAGRERLRRLRGRKNAYLARRMRDLPDEDVETLERAAEILEALLEDKDDLSTAVRKSFDSLSVPNYRRYFTGQVISLSGTWMQTVAAIWLILSLTNSGLAVGLATALQFLPMLVFGAWGGLLADRFPKRRLLIATQALMAIPAVFLFAITATGVVQTWMVYLAIFAMGMVNAVDNPTRQSFVIEMVGADRVVNAVSLNSVIVQSARLVGPAIAGLLIAAFGVVPCFALNALTFVAMIVALWGMNPEGLHSRPVAPREPGAIRAGLRYVLATPDLLVPLALMALVGTLGFNFQVVLPLLAKFSFEGGAMTYGVLVSAMAVGSMAGALVNGAQGRTGGRLIAAGALAFGVSGLLSAAMPSLLLEIPMLAGLGAAAVIFAATINSTLQLTVSHEMRGRVMALYSVVFLGSTPIGAPIVGWLSEAYDPRVALALAGVTGFAAAWAARVSFARIQAGPPAEGPRLAEASG